MAKGAPGARRRFVDLTLRFWDAYLERIGTGPGRPEGLVPRAIDHAAACVLARVDGKSPVEYLDPAGQELARRLAPRGASDAPANVGRDAEALGATTPPRSDEVSRAGKP